MTTDIERIPILKRPPIHKLVASWLSDEDQPIHVFVELALDQVRESDPGRSTLYAKRERVIIERLHHDRRRQKVVFAGNVVGKDGRKKYPCAGSIHLKPRPSDGLFAQGWLVDMETPDFFTDCVRSPLPSLWWRRAMGDANELVESVVGDRRLGAEIVRRTISTMSREMRRLPNICPDCGQEVSRSDWGAQLATCPMHGQLDNGGDMVIAIGDFGKAFGLS